MHSMRCAYLKRLQEVDLPEEVTVLPSKKCGRPFNIGDLESQLSLYILRSSEQGGIITTSVVVAAAYGMLKLCSHMHLAEFSAHVTPSTFWAYHFGGARSTLEEKQQHRNPDKSLRILQW